jgi:hypothetical protein
LYLSDDLKCLLVIDLWAMGDAASVVCTGTLRSAWGSRNPLVWLLWIITRQGLTLSNFVFIKRLRYPFRHTPSAAC